MKGMKYIMNDKEYSKRVKIIFCIFFIWYGINCLFLLFKMLLCLPESLIDLGADLTPYFILFSSLPIFLGIYNGYFIYFYYSKLGIIIILTSIIGIIIWQIYLLPFIL